MSGIANGLFTAPMKVIREWKWENIWLIFILVSCILMPAAVVLVTVGSPISALANSPAGARTAALAFGFAWGFGAILFGLSVDHLGVSLANSLVIGISAAAGSTLPLVLRGGLHLETRLVVLFAGVASFLVGVALCAQAGRLRELKAPKRPRSGVGYLYATAAGLMSAVFNVGYSLAQPIAETGERLGFSRFHATNVIWLLMLGAGSIPNIIYCVHLIRKHSSSSLYLVGPAHKNWGLSASMGVLWGGSIFLYGAATPLLGDIGPSIGWPLSLAMALVVANFMGALLGEWKSAAPQAVWRMRLGVLTMLVAIVLCAFAAQVVE